MPKKITVRFLCNANISEKILVSEGEVRKGYLYEEFAFIDFGNSGIVKAPLSEMDGIFEII